MKTTLYVLQISLLALLVTATTSWANTTEYTTGSGKTILITETHPNGQSLSTISIESRGFAYNLKETIEDSDPTLDVFLADLDSNGFDEIYIITAGAGSGSYGDVLGFASNRDKSLSMIHFPEIEEGDQRFSGYMGHDAFSLKKNNLLRTFPVYLPNDSQNKATGGTRTVRYELHPGEAAWQLRIIPDS